MQATLEKEILEDVQPAALTLIEHNPLLKRSLLTMLSLAASNPEVDRDEIELHAAQNEAELFKRQSPTTIVDILIRNEALIEEVYVDGKLYPGTLHDVHLDDSIADEAHIAQLLSLTPSGSDLLNAYSDSAPLHRLFASKPQYVEVFKTMLRLCSSEEGCSRSELEHALSTLPELAPNPATGEHRIYPQFFIDSLETADGIAWRGTWQTTETGRLVM